MPNSKRPFFIVSLLALSSLANVRAAIGEEIFPGRIRDPPGNQETHVIEYSSGNDEYLLAYYGEGVARVGHLSVDGIFSNEISFSTPTTTVNRIGLVYNAVDDQYLLVTREDTAQAIRAHYLDADGNALGGSFAVGTGGFPNLTIAYSPDSGRYLVVWDKGPGSIRYAVVDADSTNPTPVLATGAIETVGAISSRVVYGTVSQKFFIGYSRNGDIYGKFVSADGMTLTSRFPIDTANLSQDNPVAAYHAGNDRFIIGYLTRTGGLPDLKVSLVAPDKTVTRRFNVVAETATEWVQAIVYNETTDTVFFAWRHSGAVEDVRAREWEVSDDGAGAVGSLITLSDLNPGAHDGAARNNPDDPQVTFVWGSGNAGSDGIHAGIVHGTPSAPDLTPPGDVTDLAAAPGGTLGTVDLTWTAPGDDGQTGAAKTYHVVMSQNPILDESDFNAADPVLGADAIVPQLAGNLESFTATGLPSGTTMYFALKTEDESANVSGMSNVAEVITPGSPSISIPDVSLPEGDAGTTAFDFTVTLSSPRLVSVSVDFATASAGATPGVDYVETSGMVVFPVGTTEQVVSVTVFGDGDMESAEAFAVDLTNAVNADLANLQGIGTIVNDDCSFSNDVALANETFMGMELIGACATITTGLSVAIETPGDVTFRAGQLIVLDNGFSVGTGASFAAEIEPGLVP